MKNEVKIFVILILCLFMGITVTTLIVGYSENEALTKELYATKAASDSTQKVLLRKNLELINLLKETQHKVKNTNFGSSKDKYVDGILLGKKPISLQELIDLANKHSSNNVVLRNKAKNDSLVIDRLKSIIGQLKKDKILVEDKKGSLSYRQISQVDSLYELQGAQLSYVKTELQAKNMLLDLIKKNYDIDTKVDLKDNVITVKLINTDKLDSALWIFPYYKHKIKKNRKGETIIR